MAKTRLELSEDGKTIELIEGEDGINMSHLILLEMAKKPRSLKRFLKKHEALIAELEKNGDDKE